MFSKFAIAPWAIAVVLAASSTDPAVGQTFPLIVAWSTREFQPSVSEGGRANAFAVHPDNASDSIVYATSETGGLFRTTDRGVSWRHIDSLPCYGTNSVAVLAASSNVVLVTTRDDYKTTGGGGLWRSTDSGATWTQAALGGPAGARMSGYEIAVAADTGAIFVGTSAGCVVSIDNGATWVRRDPFGGNAEVFAVAALGGGRVLAGGWGGISRSTDNGATWALATTGPGSVTDLHALCGSPLSQLDAYAVNNATQLFRTTDGGDTWAAIPSAPAGGGGCGGIGFVKAVPVLSARRLTIGVTLYFSNRCGVVRLRCLRNPFTNQVNYSGSWEGLTIDHADTRDLTFRDAGVLRGRIDPYLLGTDGGVHTTANGGANWTFIGGGRSGFNALQITEVFGQTIDDVGRHDLYYGTQDNNLYSSGDGGTTWANPQCCEGFFIDSVRRIARAADAKVTFVACSGCGNFVSDPLFVNVNGWANVVGAGGNPRALGTRRHVQGVEPDSATTFAKGLAITTDLGATWQQFASFPEARLDLPKVAAPRGIFSLHQTVLYQAIRVGDDPVRGFPIDHLVRITKSPFIPGEASVHYPAMTGFGGLGINPTMFAWYEVFGVNPDDPNQIIAPDIVNERMMRSQDGGETWIEMTELTRLVTDNGQLRFRNWMFPIVSAVSFCPDNPALVMVGTAEGGVFVSKDGGGTWSRVAGSERATLVSSIHWRTANDVVVSTYGRGLWRLSNRIVIRIPDLDRWCRRPCEIWRFPIPRPDPPPYDRGILVYDGVIRGARIEDGRVREVFVSPGASVVHAVARETPVDGVRAALPDVKVTESAKWVGFPGAATQPVPPQKDWVVKGLLLDATDRPLGAVYGDRAADMHFAPPPRLADNRPNRSRIADKPYARVASPYSDGGPSALPGEPIRLTGDRFPAGTELVVVIDGKVVGEKVRVTPNGTLAVAVPAPRPRGFHRIELRRGDATGPVIDAVTVLVKNMDRPSERGKEKK